MKFALGYQLSDPNEDSFVDVVRDFKNHIAEVYFPWLDMPSGRMPLTKRRGFTDWQGQAKLEGDLKKFKKMGLGLDLLLNANCYGKHAVSRYLEQLVCSIIEHIKKTINGPDAVTTTSPAIAQIIRRNFPDIETRASVNMRIGTVPGMAYLADLFDGFYLQREYNRDFDRIAELKNWADRNGKKLYLLANSGCLSFCSGQTFHDNLVAHEAEIAETVNLAGWNPILCCSHYQNRKNWVSFLQSSWIRPEDIKNYEPYFPMVKLATRMHANPRKVIQAYAEGKFNGNLLDLCEPSHEHLFPGYVIANSRFPKDWFKKTTGCDRKCGRCGYCAAVLKETLVRME